MSESRFFKSKTEGDIHPAQKPAALRRSKTVEKFLSQMQEVEAANLYKELMLTQARVDDCKESQPADSRQQLEVKTQLLGDLLSGKVKQDDIHHVEDCSSGVSVAAPVYP